MASIQINKVTAAEHGSSIEMICGNKTAFVYSSSIGYLQVICQNAAHKCFRGAGKVFHGDNAWGLALDAYKSADMKAMIECAKNIIRK